MPKDNVQILETAGDDGYPIGKYTWKGVARISNDKLSSSRKSEKELKIELNIFVYVTLLMKFLDSDVLVWVEVLDNA